MGDQDVSEGFKRFAAEVFSARFSNSPQTGGSTRERWNPDIEVTSKSIREEYMP
jgi:hypothetical protein